MDRKELWDKWCALEDKLRVLKSIVQNEMGHMPAEQHHILLKAWAEESLEFKSQYEQLVLDTAKSIKI